MAWFRFRPNQRSKLQSRPRPKLPLLIAHSRVTEQVACSKSNPIRIVLTNKHLSRQPVSLFLANQPQKIPSLSLLFFWRKRKRNHGAGSQNKLSAWVDNDFASHIDTRKSVTGYLMVLNGGPISWKASRQAGVTLSSSEAEFVAASQD